jgi:archaellin
MELTGGIIASSNTTQVTDITFDLTLAAGGDSVNLNPSDATNRTVISYQDANITNNDLTYVTTVITGDADNLLEPGELLEVSIDLSQDAAIVIGTNETFTFEVKPPQGSYLVIQRTTPASINQSVINLN